MLSLNRGLLPTLAATAVLFSQTVVGQLNTLSLPFNTTHSHGPDGPWNFITLNIGSNSPSVVDFYPAWGDKGDLLVTQDACTQSSCIASAPNYYDQRSQSAQNPNIDRNLVEIGDNWNLRHMLNLHGNGYNSIVDINSPENLKNNFAVVTSNLTQALGRKTFTPVSLLSLEPSTDVNITKTNKGDNVTQVTMLQGYHQLNGDSSRTVSIHYGSAAFNQTGSLIVGGYDQDRMIEPPAVFDHLVTVNITSIKFNVNSSDNPWASSVNQPSEFIDSKAPLATLISPHVANFLFPDSLCRSFANFLPLQYDEDTNLYLWKTDSPAYKQLISSPGNNMQLTFKEDHATGASIRIPFALLDLTLTAPVKNTPTQYFPCEARSDTINLGRAFLQSAIVVQSYTPGKMWIGQAPGPGATGSNSKRATPNIQTLSAANPDVKAMSNAPKWEDTWSGHLPLDKSKAPAATAPASSSTAAADTQASQGLSGGAIAGIVIGVIVLLAAIAGGVFFFLRRRKAQKTSHQPFGVVVTPEVDGVAPPKYEPNGQYGEYRRKEMNGPYSPVATGPVEIDGMGYRQPGVAYELGDTPAVHAHQLP